MRATEILELQHRTIARVARACGELSEEVRKSAEVPVSVLHDVVEFFRRYGQQYHQAEEQWLFSTLRRHGVSAEGCPIGVLDHEHEDIARLINQVAAGTAAYEQGDAGGIQLLVDGLHGLSSLYAEHIWKEDYLLLPMAEKMLSDDEQELLRNTIQLIEADKGDDARRVLERLSTAITMCDPVLSGAAPEGCGIMANWRNAGCGTHTVRHSAFRRASSGQLFRSSPPLGEAAGNGRMFLFDCGSACYHCAG
jgi:hemerythrin-like domain-containing protein